jgi:hypothetical protein
MVRSIPQVSTACQLPLAVAADGGRRDMPHAARDALVALELAALAHGTDLVARAAEERAGCFQCQVGLVRRYWRGWREGGELLRTEAPLE